MGLLLEEIISGGGQVSLIVRRGQALRLTDLEGGGNVSAMMLNAGERSERLNVPDSLKCQHTTRLTAGHCLYSDMGRILAAIVDDSCGWHDALAGVSGAAEVAGKYGIGRYQELRNGFYRNGVDNLLVEMGKWGLGIADLMMTINFFSRVDVDLHGALQFVSGNSSAGDSVTLYAPMDTLMVMTAIQHPLDPSPGYAPRSIGMSLFDADADMAHACRTACPENQRGFINTDRFFL